MFCLLAMKHLYKFLIYHRFSSRLSTQCNWRRLISIQLSILFEFQSWRFSFTIWTLIQSWLICFLYVINNYGKIILCKAFTRHRHNNRPALYTDHSWLNSKNSHQADRWCRWETNIDYYMTCRRQWGRDTGTCFLAICAACKHRPNIPSHQHIRPPFF